MVYTGNMGVVATVAVYIGTFTKIVVCSRESRLLSLVRSNICRV